MIDNQAQIIKTITPQVCPHCNKQIFVNQYMIQPSVLSILTEQNLIDAKNIVRLKISEIKFKNQQEQNSFLEWLDDSNTLFGPDDVESIIEEVKNLQNNDSPKRNTPR